jgi:alpha-tubulin suppressor-like RCC1 family protein
VLAAGHYHSLARKTDGTLWAWGQNNLGQLGIGNTTNQTVPVQVGAATNWASISVGDYHSFALKTDGTLWAWGYNISGQLGIGNTTNQTVPVQLGSATDWASVDGGYAHTLALKTDGTLWAAGYNYYGQLGIGSTTDQNILVPVVTASVSTEVVVNICLDFTGLDPQYCDNAAATTLTGNHAPEGTFDRTRHYR